MKSLILTIVMLVACGTAKAVEESLDLAKVETSAPKKEILSSLSKMQIMGRVDLTNEFSPYKPDSPKENDQFKNYHYFIFLKVKPSEKVSFLGEIVNKTFFDVTYELGASSKIHFGKILVPFGDTRRFHHNYGGIQNYGVTGVMFPNVWAENGLDVETGFKTLIVDTFWISGIAATSTTDPDLTQPSSNKTQAVGTRATYSGVDNITLMASGYFDEWVPGKKLTIIGLDASTEYGLFGAGAMSHFRLGLGRAVADIQQTSLGAIKKSGDYAELTTNALPSCEFRVRYGTYVDNDQVQTAKDVHNFNVAALASVDVIRLLIEYQWNFEAVNEVQNDVLRIMASLDF